MAFKNFRVPGKDIKVRPHELLVINTPTFQRLFNIKQLGLTNLVYPFATHTRASHCLDCMDIAQKMVDALIVNLEREKDSKEIKEKEELIRMSALLHDIMHIPYAHTLEDENSILEKGDKSERIDIMIAKIKDELIKPTHSTFGSLGIPSKSDYNKIVSYLKDVQKVLWTIALHNEENFKEKEILEPSDYYIADIIGNTISADLLSYIIRDVDHTGIEKRPGPWYRIFDYFTLANDEKERTRLAIKLTKGGVRHDVISAILGVLDVRYALTEVVVYHHAKCAASALLGKIAYLCKLAESKELYSIGDEQFLKLLEDKIEKLDEESKDAPKRLLENLRRRRLYKRIFNVTIKERESYDTTHIPKLADRLKSPVQRAKIEEEIEKELGLPQGTIIIFCPSSEMAFKEASVMVVYDKVKEIETTGAPERAVKLNGREFEKDYPEIFKRVKNVQEQYLALWNLYVFLDPEKFLYTAIIQDKLEDKDKLNVKNNDQFQLYLKEKEEYELSKKFALAIKKKQSQLPSYVFNEVNNQLAARGEISSLDEETIEIIVNSAITECYSKTSAEKIKESIKGKSTLFPEKEMDTRKNNIIKK